MGFSGYFLIAALFVISGTSLAAYSGEYIPKSYYIIDSNGYQSDVYPIRTKRDLLQPFLRTKRGVGGAGSDSYSSASSSAHASSGSSATASSSSSATASTGVQGIHPTGGGSGGYSRGGLGAGYSGGGGSNVGGHNAGGYSGGGGQDAGGGYSGGNGYSTGAGGHQGTGGAGYNGGDYHPSAYDSGFGQGATHGYDGPILFSRFGEDTGTGVKVSGQAQGPNAAFASSSSSIDDQGKIKYSVQSGKY